jgi:citrate synthase
MAEKADTTRICGYDPEHITVRGKDLVQDLIGHLTFSQMILFQLTGQLPSAVQTRILDAVLVTIMEHGLVPSAIVTRLTHYGAPESVQGAIAAGLLGVGDRFAGTASECAELLESIGAAAPGERAALASEIVRSHRQRKHPLPGFGHTIHTRSDPRVGRLTQIVRAAGTSGRYLEALEILERALESVLGRKLVMNVSAAIAAALGEAGVPAKATRGIVLTARCAGLAGHLYEEMQRPISAAISEAVEEHISYEPPEGVKP